MSAVWMFFKCQGLLSACNSSTMAFLQHYKFIIQFNKFKQMLDKKSIDIEEQASENI